MNDLLSRLEVPSPPDALRRRVLETARVVPFDPPIVEDAWSRIYADRRLRAAWVLAAVVLVLANVFVGRGNGGNGGNGRAERPGDAELRESVVVPRLREAYLSMDGVPAPLSQRKEEKS